MKKLCVFLAAILLLTGLQTGRAAGLPEPSQPEAESYIVKLKETGARTMGLMNTMDAKPINTDAQLYQVDSLEAVEALGDRVLYAEPDYPVTLFALPNDPHLSKQWGVNMLGADLVWDAGFDGKGVKIAVIDSGVNSMHEDFEGTSFERGKNMLNGSYDVTDTNKAGHGTFISGVLAAVRNNGKGIAGIVDGVTLVPLKCFGQGTETESSYVIASIYEAVDIFDCDVINMSMGMEGGSRSLKEAVEYATQKGVIIVAAVGNEGTTKLKYPAAYDSVVGVGAVDQNGELAPFSQRNSSVFVTAPGVDIVSLSNTGNSRYEMQGQGTSYAAPFVSAAAAILKQYRSSAGVEDFKQILRLSTKDAGAAGYDTSYGYGILDMNRFINEMKLYYKDAPARLTDISGHWAEESIVSCVEQGLFQGTTGTTFEPETGMNRAMFVTVLSRLSGEDISDYINPFYDVPENSWYNKPCAWADARGVAGGTGDGAFSPMLAVSREQMAALLYRYALAYGLTEGSAEPQTLTAFSDGEKVSDWAQQAMAWAVETGLITGRDASTLAPAAGATRAEVAVILIRFINSFAV